jgi:carbon-monoxide dehydrogenase small subunit
MTEPRRPETITVSMTVNRRPTTVEIEPSEPIAYTLRTRLGLTGTKVSCDVQVCGACTVLVDGLPRSGCTFLAYEASGRDVLTIEGLAPTDDALDPVQAAFLEESAFQCGFCTSGMLLAGHAWLTAEADHSDASLVDYLSGNLCRCTGYLSIVAAMLAARDGRPGAPTTTRDG